MAKQINATKELELAQKLKVRIEVKLDSQIEEDDSMYSTPAVDEWREALRYIELTIESLELI